MASPFPNDGSFLERFKQQQQNAPSKTSPVGKSSSKGIPAGGVVKGSLPNGKLAFSLKQKSKLAVNPIKLGEDEDDEGDADAHRQAKRSRTETAPRSVTPEAKDSGMITPRLLLSWSCWSLDLGEAWSKWKANCWTSREGGDALTFFRLWCNSSTSSFWWRG